MKGSFTLHYEGQVVKLMVLSEVFLLLFFLATGSFTLSYEVQVL